MLYKIYFIFYLSVHFAVLVSKSTHLLNNFFKFWYYVHVFVVNLTGRNRQIHIPIKYFVFNYQFVQYFFCKFDHKLSYCCNKKNLLIYSQNFTLCFVLYIYRRDFRLLVATPGDPTKPFPHPVIWFSDSVKNLVSMPTQTL
jgi:hypothetical protein